MRRTRTEHYILVALCVSSLLHGAVTVNLRRLAYFQTGSRRVLTVQPHLQRYEFISPPAVVKNPNATPEASPPKETRMASDRNAVARNLAPKNLPMSDLPYSEGDSKDSYNLVPRGDGAPPGGGGSQRASRSASSRAEGQTGRGGVTPQGESRGDSTSYTQGGAYGQGISRIPSFDNRGSAVPKRGGMSFNTYDWNFGPYMMNLQERIQANIIPPAEYSLLGLIEGVNHLRFRIGRNGELLGVEVLSHAGSELLLRTSTKAVEKSNPFLPLPPNFPAEFLVVTAHFRYEVLRSHRDKSNPVSDRIPGTPAPDTSRGGAPRDSSTKARLGDI